MKYMLLINAGELDLSGGAVGCEPEDWMRLRQGDQGRRGLGLRRSRWPTWSRDHGPGRDRTASGP